MQRLGSASNQALTMFGTLNAKIQDMAAIARDRPPRTIDDYQQAGCLMYGFLIHSGTHLERMLNRSYPPL
jgi:hypothetical protein